MEKAIKNIIKEELQELLEETQIFSIPDLAKFAVQNMTGDKETKQAYEPLYLEALQDEFREKGDDGVVKTFKEIWGSDIYPISKGRYSFEKVYGEGEEEKVDDTISNNALNAYFEEGVADKYAEKAFNIPDPNAQQDITAKGELQKDIEKPVAKVDNTPVYKNPKSLENFGYNVRAIADYKGDLYIAQEDGSFNHGKMGNILFPEAGEWKISIGGVYENLDKYALLQRIGNTNEFGLSDSNYDYIEDDETKRKASESILLRTKQKNPQYIFYNDYYDNAHSFPVGTESGYQKEGVADKYAEKQFNIPDPNAQQNAKASGGLQKNAEKPFAYAKFGNVPIYKNPKSLEHFGRYVRAIGDITGNLYVAEKDGGFMHGQMGRYAGLEKDDNEVYSGKYLLLYRDNLTNNFILSDTASEDYPKYKKYFNEIIKNIKVKNPQYNINANVEMPSNFD